MSRGVKKGDKVAILLMNCLEWLPIYFGTLKTGALAVPMNFRYSAEEIEYCLDLAEADVLVFGPEFIGRIETIAESISKKRQMRTTLPFISPPVRLVSRKQFFTTTKA